MKKKKCYIVGAVILSIFFISVLAIYFTLLNDNTKLDTSDTDISTSFTRELIVQIGSSDLWALDIDTNNSSFVVRHWKGQIHSFDFYLKKTIYIASPGIGKPIRSSVEQYFELSQPSDWVADKIAVDHVNGKVYALDVSASNINIFDMMNEHYNIVISQFRGSKDITLDSTKRLLFVLQSTSIVSAEIDGSARNTIVETTVLSSFTIDHNRTIYYTDLEYIHSVNYTGHEHHIVAKTLHIVISIAALEESIFWICEFENSILYSCKIVSGSCANVSRITFSERLMQIKAYNFEAIHISNPCKDPNRGCDHMCVMSSDDSSRCVCSIGWLLDTDSKSCLAADDFLLYIEGDYMKTQILDASAESFTKAMQSIQLNASFSSECHFDFGVRNRMFIFTDGNSIYKMDLITGSKLVKMENNLTDRSLIHLAKSSEIIPAVDWISNNLYYVAMETYEMEIEFWCIKVHYMESISLSKDKYIFNTDYDLENITSLIVHPNRGVLYCTRWILRSQLAKINVVHLDGEFSSDYGQNLSVSRDRNVLGVDYEENRLYWFNKDKKEIHFSDLNWVNVKNINIKTVTNPLTISIYNDWLYMSTLNSVWRLNKITGQNLVKILPKFEEGTQRVFGAKVFSYNMQHVDKSHPCAIYNGDCQRYCFGVPSEARMLRKVCGCHENERLNPDGKTCYSL